ncbi:MAG: penicillin-binding protein [Chloroflexi bacterium]|nr:penicillin-binding protein [Chloroflexota bacterium]
MLALAHDAWTLALHRSRWGAVTRAALLVVAGAAGVTAALLVYAHLAPLTPLDEQAPPAGTLILDRHGTPLLRDASAGTRILVALDDIAPIALAATVAAEDQRFWRHPGVDPLAVARALGDGVAARGRPRGASTLTQQLARRLYLADGEEPRLLRKAREALISLQLEARHSKRELLEAYLNHVYYGRGAYGIEAASRRYFGVSAQHLGVAQASYLAGLPQLPAVYGDEDAPAGALARQRYVLDRLVATGAISEERATDALATPLVFAGEGDEPLAPHFTTMVLDELTTVRPDLAGRDGLVVETTLDATLQRAATRSLRVRLERIAAWGAGNGAVVVIEPATGALVALVGSADFEETETGQVNMALAPRQTGSALKPLLYAAAFEHGYTAGSMLLDVPSSFPTPIGVYTPVNADHRYRGPVALRTALASSLNVPAVRTLDRIGAGALVRMANRAGLSEIAAPAPYGLSLALGSAEVPLLRLATAFGAIATGGELAESYTIERVRDARTDAVLYERKPPPPRPVMSPGHAFILADILSDPIAREPGFGAGSVLETPFPAAVKTGTTFEFRDNWTVGFTPDRVVGVWVGNAEGGPMLGLSGVDGAGPVWRDVIEAATAGRPLRAFEPPPSVVTSIICAPTGLRPGPHCPSPVTEWFVDGTEPEEIEAYYVLDADGALAVDPPLEARTWAERSGIRLADTYDQESVVGVAIVQPVEGAVLYFAPELQRQETVLRATVPAGAEHVEFRVDGATVGRATGPDAFVVWPMTRGEHTLEVIATFADGATAAATSHYEVRDP